MVYYRPQTKLREGNVFTPVSDSVHGRGACVVERGMGSMHDEWGGVCVAKGFVHGKGTCM